MPVLTIAAKLDRFPPVLCRILARTGGRGQSVRALTSQEVAKRASMSIDEVQILSMQTQWTHVPVGTMFRFSQACGVDFCSRASMDTHAAFLRKTRGLPAYLLGSPEWDRVLRHLANIYLASQHEPETKK